MCRSVKLEETRMEMVFSRLKEGNMPVQKSPIERAVERRKIALGESLLDAIASIERAETCMLDSVLYIANGDTASIQDAIHTLDEISTALNNKFRDSIVAARNQRENKFL